MVSRQYKVAIDPGHGGRDPGAVGPGGTKEKTVTLAVSLLVDRYLRQAGVATFLTRSYDVALGSDTRTDLIARTKAINAAGCDIAVSIHCDSLKPTNDHFGVYVIEIGGRAENLAHAIINRVKRATGWSWGSDDDGVREKNLHMVRETKMPAVLIECNFISNPTREAELKDPAFQEKLARAIADGILDYLGVEREEEDDLKQVKINIDGKPVKNGYLIDNTAYVPARAIAEALGGKVEWDPKTETVKIEGRK
jgi:N-acetylmuramoyl-L-alanine amidase